jgi:hypothetical protein
VLGTPLGMRGDTNKPPDLWLDNHHNYRFTKRGLSVSATPKCVILSVFAICPACVTG